MCFTTRNSIESLLERDKKSRHTSKISVKHLIVLLRSKSIFSVPIIAIILLIITITIIIIIMIIMMMITIILIILYNIKRASAE